MNKILYAQFIAGALLKFDSIDRIDLSLLVRFFEEKTQMIVRGSSWSYIGDLNNTIRTKSDGSITLQEGIALDSIIEDEQRTVREKFLKTAGCAVNDFFNSLDIEQYRQKKKELLDKNKRELLKNGNVLLISDVSEDYDELKGYGFQHIDYFRSIIIADRYFSCHPEELKQYHIIIEGCQNVEKCSYFEELSLKRKLREMVDKSRIIKAPLNKYNCYKPIKISTFLTEVKNGRCFEAIEDSRSHVFDRIVEMAFMNRTFDQIGPQEFTPHTEYVNPNRLTLPRKKKDLKILHIMESNLIIGDKLAKDLGLDIYNVSADNFSLSKYAVSHLGEYDIIIASESFLQNLIIMNNESTEQCKETGRELTLLMTYGGAPYLLLSDDILWLYDDIGEGLKIYYSFGGNLAPDSEYHRKEFRTPLVSNLDEEGHPLNNDSRQHYTQMRGIIEAAVNIYNDTLIKNDKPAIEDLDLKSAERMDSEYVAIAQKRKKFRDVEMAPITAFDDMAGEILRYLNNCKNHWTNEIPEGLKIVETASGIKIDLIEQGRTLCAIVIAKSEPTHSLRIFAVQVISKKGLLSSPQNVALYTSEYKESTSIPSKPDERQEKALLAIEKKVNDRLRPINERALENKKKGTKKFDFKKRSDNRSSH